ncbi:LuxR family transcriptional regulator [Pararhizobium sp. IMCC21322]|uniref:helix-turn-helix transcriptional regulator n=1 Tax=Pararhizobium sp. IMCC21322 TaxID=3067903 RepID=UPI0027415135|nr:LuxR family transcriptional regulator [Pararhizobium sp. IMCC21322]
MSVVDFIGKIHELSSAKSVWEFSLREFSKCGIASLCHGYADGKPDDAPLTLRNNYPEPWKNIYYQRGAYRYDLYAQHVATSTSVIQIDGLQFDSKIKEDSLLFEEVNDIGNFGINNGFIVPLRLAKNDGFGGMFIGDIPADEPDPHGFLVTHKHDFLLMAMHLDAKLVQIATRDAQTEVNLTKRESECLTWLASGMLNDKIAERLKISNSTVEFHLRNARHKLKTRTREQAVAVAIGLGIIKI